MLDTIKLADRARQLEDHGYKYRAECLRERLELHNCCTDCGSRLAFFLNCEQRA